MIRWGERARRAERAVVQTASASRGGMLRQIVKRATAIDRSSIEFDFVLRLTVGVAVPLIAASLAGNPVYGIAAAVGANCTGFASRQGVYRTSVLAMLATAAAMSLATLVGGLSGHALPVLIVVVLAWGYACGVLAGLGPASTSVGLNSMVALVVFSDLRLGLAGTAVQALLVLGGGLLETLLVVVLWPLRRYPAERRVLASVYRMLAQSARSIAENRPSLPGSDTLAKARTTLNDPQPFGRRGDRASFRALLDGAERIRTRLGLLASDQERADDDAAKTIASVALLCAGPLEEIATALEVGRAPAGDTTWMRAEDLPAPLLDANDPVAVHARTVLGALRGQLRSMWRTASFPAVDERSERDGTSLGRIRVVPPIADTFVTIRTNLSLKTAIGRHAIRLAVTLAVGMLVAETFRIPHGYWLAMTTLLVLQPDFTTTFARGVARVAGTAIGAVVATAIALYLHPGSAVTVTLCITFAAFAALFIPVNYGLFTIAITAFVAFALTFVGQPEATAVADRVTATLLGGALAGIAYLVWPTWEARRTSTSLADLLEADRAYAGVLFAAYTDPAARDRQAIREAQSTTWAARADAEASIDRMLSEPGRTHALDRDQVLGVLAASRRLALALLTLNGHLDEAVLAARPALRAFVDAFDRAMHAAVDALHDGSALSRYPSLRDAYERLENELPVDADAELVLALTDVIVDAVNTIAELLASTETHVERAGDQDYP